MYINEKIRTFIGRFTKGKTFSDSDNIFETGLVNSLFAMQLVQFIETEFNISIDNADLNLENFKNVDAIVNLIERKGIK
nr:phosphopantetheine-binding protein [uncultured Blautia sp.]